MRNFRDDILTAVEGEEILAVRIDGAINYWRFDPESDPRDVAVKPFYGRICTWEEINSALDYQYDAGFGAMDCHDIKLWTPTKVFFIHEYDGSTSIISEFRNPT